MRQAIPGFIGLLLFLAVLRILPDAAAAASLRDRLVWSATLTRVLLAQLILHPGQSITKMLATAFVLLTVIGTSVLLAALFSRHASQRRIRLNPEALDGLSALALALMVIGLMSAIHTPANDWLDIGQMLLLAVIINAGFQCLGVIAASVVKQERSRKIGMGVVYGNRNIALFLAALPATQMEPLLLFIACFQVPMYLTPLIGDVFYRRLE